jgi:hypothetical protein
LTVSPVLALVARSASDVDQTVVRDMNRSALWCLALASGACVAASAFAQTSAPMPARPASAASAAQPGAPAPAAEPRVRTAAEVSKDALNPDDARPNGPETTAVPQVRIPFGKTPPQPETAPGVKGGIDDSAAHCEAVKGEQARVKCREQARLDARAKSGAR